ncbi:ComEA family DNA-binding protein [Williamsia serinedens]|uniref:Competence protein ComEA n=1 Tax=Williamsia serinedens TaxID=391736 RepID=A0ABT1H6B3_9NOCA|nr:ComEA family DNA-binding protein [Williamsia serinedens]MCP2162779.1 competence protein ComEA [Williamsia serinedens]
MYLRASRDGRPDVLARLAAAPPAATMQPGAASDLSLDRPAEVVPSEPDPASSWLWDEPHGAVDGPSAPRWIDDVPRRRPDTDPPDDRRPRRRDRALTAPPAAIALVVIGVLACVVTIVTVASGSSDDVPTSVAFPSSAGPVSRTSGAVASGERGAPPASPVPSAAATELVVSVVGLVRTPGLVRLPATARIADAIARAGGGRPGADLLGLNMAQPLHDGDQVLVGYADPAGGPALRSAVVSGGGAPGAAPGAAAPGAAAPRSAASPSAAAGGPVNLNTADAAALDALPGVGPKTAAAILEWRQRNGRFASVDQLAEVDGIGPAKFASLRDLVTV